MATYDDRVMYPEIEPFHTGTLQVTDLHTIYYEQCGNPNGVPVVFLHGGPGSDTGPRDRRYFDPEFYHVILFHQRGSGKSTPAFCIQDNNTWALVDDMEELRKAVGVDRWLLFGGSWGSTLALAYAETHIDHVLGLIIRGIFTNRKMEQDWVYNAHGPALLYPEEYDKFVQPIPEDERTDITKAYHKRIFGSDEKEKMRCATAWNRWELVISGMQISQELLDKCNDDHWNLAHATMECHYFINDGFFKPNQLMDNARIIAESGVPLEIVQGRYDLVCPMKTAWDLHTRVPQSVLNVMPMAGHSAKEEGSGMTEKLVEICNKFKTTLKNNNTLL